MDTFASSPADPAGSNSPIPGTLGTFDDVAGFPLTFAMSGLFLLDGDPSRFDQCCADLLGSVDPADPMERLLAEQVILTAERLRRAALLEDRDGIPSADWCRFQTLAERHFRLSQKELRQHRERRQHMIDSALARQIASETKSKSGAKSSKKSGAPEPAEPAPPPHPPRPESTPEQIADASANWRKYIAIVQKRSIAYPVLLRTGREVEDVCAWLSSGRTEETLMGWFPELSLADLAACKACDAEGMCGPFDPGLDPYPPTLPILDDFPDEADDLPRSHSGP